MSNGYWIPAICPNCGANMSVAKDDVHANCPYCGSSFVANRATAKFNATYMANHINANVAYFGDNSKDFEIVAGELKRYTGSGVDVVVPDGVEAIGPSAFRGQGIHSVYIPSTTTTIKDEAFFGCSNLLHVKMSGVKKIGESVFWECSMLTEINLPITLTEIGQAAFFRTNLRTVTVRHRSVLATGRAFMATPLEEIKIRGTMNSFFSKQSWPGINPLFIGLDNLKAIGFDDYILTPDRLEKNIDFDDRDEYNLYKTIFTGNSIFGGAMNRRLDACIKAGICPICRKKIRRGYTSGILIKQFHPDHCDYCNLDLRNLGVGLKDPNSYYSDSDYD